MSDPSPSAAYAGRGRASAGRIAGVALHAVVLATRSRFFLGMVVLLVAVTLGLPATLRGDGSLAGALRVMLDYTLGLSALLTSLALLVVACGSISREIEEGQLRLIRVKPVYPLELWLGRWLGMLLLGAALLTVAGSGTYVNVRVALARSDVGPEERQLALEQVLTAQRAVMPRAPDVSAEVEARLTELRASSEAARAIPRARLRAVLQRRALSARAAVAPDATREWVFTLPVRSTAGEARIRVRVAPGHELAPLLAGHWRLRGGTPDGPTRTESLTDVHQGVGYLRVPAEAQTPGGALHVTFENRAGDGARSAVFDVDEGLVLLQPAGGFGGNLVRALLVLFCRLALVCALGLAAGTVFSFPVALFVSFAVALLAMTGHYVVATDAAAMALNPEDAVSPLTQRLSEALIHQLERLAGPAVGPSPLARVSDGILVSWAWVGESLLRVVAGLSGVLALLSTALLHRRELAAGTR